MMGREKSDGRVNRKAVESGPNAPRCGRKATTVKKGPVQLDLFSGTAERRSHRTHGWIADLRSRWRMSLMSNMSKAFQNVARNRGAAGP